MATGKVNDRVSKSGDTMTDTLVISKYGESKIQLKNTGVSEGITPANMVWVGTLGFLDNNNNVMGYVGNNYNTSNSSISRILARRRINGTTYDNYLDLGVLSTGFPYVGIPNSAKSAWQNALGLGDSGWINVTDATKFTGTIRYRKIGNICYVVLSEITLANSRDSSSWTVLCQLPTGYRPTINGIATPVLSRGATTNAILYIYTNGEVSITAQSGSTIATNLSLYVCISFPVG